MNLLDPQIAEWDLLSGISELIEFGDRANEGADCAQKSKRSAFVVSREGQ